MLLFLQPIELDYQIKAEASLSTVELLYQFSWYDPIQWFKSNQLIWLQPRVSFSSARPKWNPAVMIFIAFDPQIPFGTKRHNPTNLNGNLPLGLC